MTPPVKAAGKNSVFLNRDSDQGGVERKWEKFPALAWMHLGAEVSYAI